MGASEKRAATFHPGSGPTGNPWTDEDVAVVAAWLAAAVWPAEGLNRHLAQVALDALVPRVAAMVRAGQAQSLREVAAELEPYAADPEYPNDKVTPLASRQRLLRRADEIERGE